MSEPRTVLLVCDYALGYLGGAQTALCRQAEALADNGVRCVVVAPGKAWDPRITVISPPVRFFLPGVQLPILPGADRLDMIIADAIRDYSPEGIVMHSEFGLAAAATRVGYAHGIRVLHTVHTFFWHAPRVLSPLAPLVTALHTRMTRLPAQPLHRGSSAIQNALRSMTKRVALQADLVISPSVHQAESLRESGIANVTVLSNVVQDTDPGDVPGRPPLVFVWAARFAPEKRLRVALDALREASARLGAGRIHLHVAGGEGTDSADVTFHGRVSSGYVDQLLAAAHGVIVTSVGFDNQPMVALEAFRRGRAVIVSDPVLAGEFGSAALCASSTGADGLADLLCDLAADATVLDDAGSAALDYADARSAAAHVRTLLALLTD